MKTRELSTGLTQLELLVTSLESLTPFSDLFWKEGCCWLDWMDDQGTAEAACPAARRRLGEEALAALHSQDGSPF